MAYDPQAEFYKEYMRQQILGLQQNIYSNGMLGGAGIGALASALGPGSIASALNVGPSAAYTPTPAINAKVLAALKASEPRMVTARMPDSITPITAWRAWALTQDGGEYRLKALGQHSIWLPKKKMEASCAKGGTNHPAPHFNCECGVWCFKSLELLVPALEDYTVPIFGNVTIWGRIIETDKGFRAQYAYPKELWLIDNCHEQLGLIYGVPVRTIAK